MRGPRARRDASGRGVLALTPRPRVLALRALGLGDLLTGVPALRGLAAAHPEHDMVVAMPRALAPLLDLAGLAATVVDASGLRPFAWSGPPPALAVNLHGRGPQSHRLLRSMRPARLVAFANGEVPHDGPAWDAEEHEVRRWCRLLEQGLGVRADPGDRCLEAPGCPAPAPGAVVVHPGAAFRARQWPPQRFGAVARWVAEHGYPVVVTGGPGEGAVAAQVRRAAGLAPDAVLAGRTDLLELAAQVAAARLVVCGDTGVAHLASAYRTPSVVLFGPTPPRQWGPPTDGPHRVLWHGSGAAAANAEQVHPALLAVTVQEVLDAVEGALLTTTGSPTRPRVAVQPSAGRTTAASS